MVFDVSNRISKVEVNSTTIEDDKLMTKNRW